MISSRKTTLIFLLTVMLVSMFAVPPSAHAGLVIKLPSGLGLSTNLVGHWTFDGADTFWTDGTTRDRSGNGNNGSFEGGLATTTAPMAGKIGQALNFDGSEDAVDAGTGLNDLSALTVSLWAKADTTGEGGLAIFISTQNASAAATSNGWRFAISGNNTVRFVVDYDGGTDLAKISANNTLVLGQWAHWVITWDGSNSTSGVHIYKNGVEISYLSPSEPVGNRRTDTRLNIGNDDLRQRTFDGTIDEVRVHSRVLSAGEIKRLYTMGSGAKVAAAQTSKLTTGLVGHWTFDGADIYESGTKAADKSGNNIAGTISGGRSTVPGRLGQALSFDGTTGGVNMGTNATLNLTGAVTVSAWLNHRGLTSADVVAGRSAGGCTGVAASQYCLVVGSTATQMRFLVSNGVATLESVTSSTAIQPRTWYHLVGIYNGTDTTLLYVNGVLVDSDTSAGYGALQSPGGAIFGVSQADRVPGTIDEVRVYNRALSVAEIKELYNQGAGAKIAAAQDKQLTTNLVGYWSFNGPDIYESGTVAADKSGNGNNGALTNFTAATGAVSGKIGQALNFDGSNDYILANQSSITNFPFTLSVWAKTSVSAAEIALSYASSASDVIFYGIGLDSLGRAYLYSRASAPEEDTVSGTTVFTGQWVHIVGVFNSTTDKRVYVNGVQEGLLSTSISFSQPNRVGVGVMARSSLFGYWNGSIDEPRVYNRALSAAEIKRLYEMGR